MQVIYHWAFAVAPALCPLHSQEWVGTCPSWIYGAGTSKQLVSYEKLISELSLR